MTQTQELSRVERIEERIDKDAAGSIEVTKEGGGMQFRSMVEAMEFAKLMAVSDIAVPKHLRGNIGACLAITIQSIEWRMSPFAVANKSYVVNDRVAYESQLIHAVIEQRAPIIARLRNRFVGEGEKRQCIVWATARGQTEPMEYKSPETGKISPKNSPLWKTKPDLQLFYNASRDWARMYYPDVILGVFAEDEIEGMNQSPSRSSVPMPRAIGEPPAELPKIIDQPNTTGAPPSDGIDPGPPSPGNDESPAGADGSDPERELPAPEAPEQHPASFNETQIVNWIVRQKPEGTNDGDAEKFAKTLVKTGLARKWDKLDPEARQLYIETWMKPGGIKWPVST